jgi:hypothetical protein
MAEGLFGGLAEGLTTGRQQAMQQQQIDQSGALGQQRLQLEQQAQQHVQQRDLYQRADKDVSNLMDTATKTVEALKLQGKDNQSIAKAVQPIIQAAKRLKQSSGGDPSSIDAQLAATLAQPGYNPPTAGSGGSAAPPAATPSPQPAAGGPSAASPSDIPAQPSGTGPQPPGQNITDQNVVKVEPQQNEIDRWTTALATLPPYAPPSMREAFQARLKNAIALNTPDATVHFAKNDDGSETPVIITKQGGKVSITDTKGNEYVPPGGTGEGGKTAAQEIADAIAEGKQPPTTTGLYKQGAAVKAQLARKGFDLTNANLEWQAAQKQVQSLNGPQMTRYAGLAKSVVNTIDEVKGLSEKMQNSGIPMLNAAKIQEYIQLQGNSEKGQLAAKYLAGVNTLKEEFANLAQGGYAPTEAAWKLAEQQINGNYGVQQLSASLTEVQRLIRYRLQGIPNFQTLGPDAPNRYKPDGGGGGTGHGASLPAGTTDWQTYFGTK